MNLPKNHAEADQLLKRKCEIAVRISEIEALMNEHIQAAKARALRARGDLDKEDAAIDRALKQYFVTLTPAELGERKSVKLNFGVFGKRGGREAVHLVRGWTEDRVIAALEAKGWASFVKTVKTYSKASVLASNAENRALLEERCGLRVEPGDTFYVEPDLEALAEYVSEPRA